MLVTLLLIDAALAVAVAAMAIVQIRRTPFVAPSKPTAVRDSTPGDEQITPPPMIDGVTLRDWLVHYNQLHDQFWPRVVTEFYQRAAEVPMVADYFRNTDMEQLQTHFTRVLTLVAGRGLSVRMVRHLRERHMHVLASSGAPITGEVYDAVIQTLAEVLDRQGVPTRGIQALADTIAPLRAEIVRA